MSFLDARNQYRKAETGVQAPLDNPHQVIHVTLKELHRSMAALAGALDAGLPPPDAHLNRALTAIYILQSSLDFEQGGEIATNLFRVYEFCRLRLLEVFRREAGASLGQAVDFIADILTAWENISAAA